METFLLAVGAAVFGHGINVDWFSRAVVWQDLLVALLGMALALWALPRLRPSYGLLLVSMLFFVPSKGPYGYVFEGMPRHVASIVPLYLALVQVTLRTPPAVRWTALSLSTALLGLLSAWFASGRWVS